uniref:Si:ch73-379j16.2 n=1 Tax=Echeneis naucrates TaxID=173247 RepID=A0A665UME0_ECHNA
QEPPLGISKVRELFDVDPTTGEITVRGQLDYELDDSYEIDIQASDSGAYPLRTDKSVTVIIKDMNDNAPVIDITSLSNKISEDSRPGTTVALLSITDLDSGVNGKVISFVKGAVPFTLTPSIQDNMYAVPVLTSEKTFRVVLSDVNDNSPEFSRRLYHFYVTENNPAGGSVFSVRAFDRDEGDNAQYSLSKTLARKVYEVFELDSLSGQIKLKGTLDFEESEIYKLEVQASDKGQPPLTGRCRVIIKIKDVNDNPPEIEVTSLSSKVSEESKPGTVISLLSVTDKDSGINAKVILHVIGDVPFELKPSYKENIYSVVTKGFLDREQVPQYEITIKATDCGKPPLSTYKSLNIQISDVNDNSPHFSQNPLQFYLVENNVAGSTIFSVRATDNDLNENAAITYHIMRAMSGNDSPSSFLNINPDNGQISALKSFDFERVKTFQFHVVASDSGSPSLSSNVTVNVFILDQNDNAPVILYPLSSNGSAEGVEEIPRNVNAGHLVTKVRAYDADIGYNGWLLFSLQEVTAHSLFTLDRYTGQIRTLRSFTETDEAEHKLLILVKDNGNVSLSATATVLVRLVAPKEAFAASDVKSSSRADEDNNVTFYLMITLASVSALFLISIIVLIAMQCSKSTDYTSKYLQETNYDGTLCHSIQYRSGDKRYMLVGPRMSIGSTIVPGSQANTLVLPDRRRTSEEVRT